MSPASDDPPHRSFGLRLSSTSNPARTTLEVLAEQCSQLRENHRIKARIWGFVHIFFGLPAAVLAAVAGVTALTSTAGRIPAGIIAIISAGLGSAATFLDSQGRLAKHDRFAKGFEAIYIECVGFMTFEVHNILWVRDTFPQEISRLRKECAELLKDQPLNLP